MSNAAWQKYGWRENDNELKKEGTCQSNQFMCLMCLFCSFLVSVWAGRYNELLSRLEVGGSRKTGRWRRNSLVWGGRMVCLGRRFSSVGVLPGPPHTPCCTTTDGQALRAAHTHADGGRGVAGGHCVGGRGAPLPRAALFSCNATHMPQHNALLCGSARHCLTYTHSQGGNQSWAKRLRAMTVE